MWVSRKFKVKNNWFYPITAHYYRDDSVEARTLIHGTIHHVKEIRDDTNEYREELRALGVYTAMHGVLPNIDIQSIFEDYEEEIFSDFKEKDLRHKYPSLYKEFQSYLEPLLPECFEKSLFLGFVTGTYKYNGHCERPDVFLLDDVQRFMDTHSFSSEVLFRFEVKTHYWEFKGVLE